MNITCTVTDGMNDREKQLYFEHMAKRHKEEAERLQDEKESLRTYKQRLIDDILELSTNYTRAELEKKTIRILERIYDYC